jgi:hypothetical protein
MQFLENASPNQIEHLINRLEIEEDRDLEEIIFSLSLFLV